MKRSTWQGRTVVYKYGLPSWAQLPEQAEEQLRLAHWLRNELVAVDGRYRELVDAIWASDPTVNAAMTALDNATLLLLESQDVAKGERVATRTTTPTPTVKTQLTDARATRRDAKTALRTAKEAAGPDLKALLKDAGRQRLTANTEVRGESVAQGLYWATANSVLEDHGRASKRLVDMWRSGRRAQRRFRRWDGTGSLTSQVMWQTGKPPRSPAVLAGERSPWRNVFRLGPAYSREDWQRFYSTGQPLDQPLKHPRWATAWVRIAKGDPIGLPIILHRPFPPDSEVTDVRIVRTRLADRYRLSLSVTLRLPAAPAKTRGLAVAVRFGWSSLGAGRVEVAQITTSGGHLGPPPLDVAGIVTPNGDLTAATVTTHPAWARLLGRDDDIRSIRAENRNTIREKVIASLSTYYPPLNPEGNNDDERHSGAAVTPSGRTTAVQPGKDPHLVPAAETNPQSTPPRRGGINPVRLVRRVDVPVPHLVDGLLFITPKGWLTPADVARWRSSDRLKNLAAAWPIDNPLYPEMVAWVAREQHLHAFEANERDQVVAWRRNAWRNVAKWLADQARIITIHELNIAEIIRTPGIGETDTPAAKAGRAQAHQAAPGELRMFIEQACTLRGVEIITAQEPGAAVDPDDDLDEDVA